MFTQKEEELIVNILKQLQINPSQVDALEIVSTIQSILKKLETNNKQDD